MSLGRSYEARRSSRSRYPRRPQFQLAFRSPQMARCSLGALVPTDSGSVRSRPSSPLPLRNQADGRTRAFASTTSDKQNSIHARMTLPVSSVRVIVLSQRVREQPARSSRGPAAESGRFGPRGKEFQVARSAGLTLQVRRVQRGRHALHKTRSKAIHVVLAGAAENVP